MARVNAITFREDPTPLLGQRDEIALVQHMTPFPMEVSSTGVSVVVPTFNRGRKLARLLRSFDGLCEKVPEEVIIVDDGSRDDTSAMAVEWLDTFHDYEPRYFTMPENGGPAKARNLGLREAKEAVVAFTDDDCVVHHRWLFGLVDALDPRQRIIGAGGSVLPLNDDLVSRYYTFHHILEPPPSLLYVVTANCCYLRSHALAAGGFETDLSKPGGEDVALSFKLFKRGYRFAMAEDAVVYHEYRRDLRDFYQTFLNYGSGCRHVTEKHFGSGDWMDDSVGSLW